MLFLHLRRWPTNWNFALLPRLVTNLRDVLMVHFYWGLWLWLLLCAGLCIELVAAVVFIRPQDVRTWYWGANAVRVAHPFAWMSAVASAALFVRRSSPETTLGGSCVLSAALTFPAAFAAPALGAAAIA